MAFSYLSFKIKKEGVSMQKYEALNAKMEIIVFTAAVLLYSKYVAMMSSRKDPAANMIDTRAAITGRNSGEQFSVTYIDPTTSDIPLVMPNIKRAKYSR